MIQEDNFIEEWIEEMKALDSALAPERAVFATKRAKAKLAAVDRRLTLAKERGDEAAIRAFGRLKTYVSAQMEMLQNSAVSSDEKARTDDWGLVCADIWRMG